MTLVTWHRPLKNPRILVCHRPGDDGTDPTKLVTVRVRDNLNFLPGMELQANQTTQAGVFDLVGSTPRARGRW